ncbi:KHDC1-like protein [Callospermophilus lateralis]|uniref:KHDC1-like protein n=1 Tax=Callospermophilus lateralis TaxID=76772 RepID=UPI0040386B75
MSTLGQKAWWTLPENFQSPLVFYMEEDLEKHVFGQGDKYLRSIELHSHTLIQLEPWFTATGQTRVIVVGPPRARKWLLSMIRSLGSRDWCYQNQGLEMLWRVRSQPLTSQELIATTIVESDTLGLSLAVRMSGGISGFPSPIAWLF